MILGEALKQGSPALLTYKAMGKKLLMENWLLKQPLGVGRWTTWALLKNHLELAYLLGCWSTLYILE
jgi:hypothetical protein